MAIANRTCVSFCNQPKANFGYLTRVSNNNVAITHMSIMIHN